MRSLLTGSLLIVLVVVHVFALGEATEKSKLLLRSEEISYVLPASILKIIALEYDGLASDYLFLQGIVFLGSTLERKEIPRVRESEWDWVFNIFSASTHLDPYFLDPYITGNAYLAWEGKKIKEANVLLEKGSHYRDWDWTLPFLIGFNDFYFLQENAKASESLMEASRRPGANPVIVSLAVKLSYKSKRTENAVSFLEQILKNTDDERLRKEYKTRLEAMRQLLDLERAVTSYKDKFGKLPDSLDVLVRRQIIPAVPNDPYGGVFYLDAQGNVRSTSDFLTIYSR